MRIAFYGDNLHAGYRFVSLFREHGADAVLFRNRAVFAQEGTAWWSSEPEDARLVREIPDVVSAAQRSLGTPRKLRALHDELRGYDVVMAMEDGPGLLCDLKGVPLVFVSQGWDLQVLPFAFEQRLRDLARKMTERARQRHFPVADVLSELRVVAGGVLTQTRQRRGIRRAARILCAPYQRPLVVALGCAMDRVSYLPFPVDARELARVDHERIEALRARYDAFDLVLLHPTRQLFDRSRADEFLKDNDKLLRGFAAFRRDRPQVRSRLLLVEKGPDVPAAKRLLADLGLESHVEWHAEMPNTELRAFYSLPNVVVCDQFGDRIGGLGSIGREASFYGRCLVTTFTEENVLRYGADMPRHIFPAQADEQVRASLVTLADLSASARADLALSARGWCERNYEQAHVVPKYLRLLGEVRREHDTGAPRPHA
jgi:glycosyltransferase involved in cell wall biosynthesis